VNSHRIRPWHFKKGGVRYPRKRILRKINHDKDLRMLEVVYA